MQRIRCLSSGLCDAERTLRRRGVVRGARVDLPGAEPVGGPWRLDAVPRFDDRTGNFQGHAGRMRRPFVAAGRAGADSPSDRMRQILVGE